MRVLLFIEPHPIRGKLVEFLGVAQQFSALLSSPAGYDVRMFANDAIFSAQKEKLTPHKDKLIRSTPSEEAFIQTYISLDWATEGLPIWVNLMEGKGEVAELYLQMLRRIWNFFPFEVIVHWGENGAVSRFLEERPITRVAMELGCTRPPFFDSVVMDPFGTNGSALVPKLGLEDIRNIVEDKPMSRHDALFGFSGDISAPGYNMQFSSLKDELDKRWQDKKIAYLPLQLFDDANLVRFSHYSSLSDVVLDVVPRLSNAGYLTIIKPHPASKNRKGALLENIFARRALMPWADSVVWCQEEATVSNARFFSLSDIVVTVNSSVGFEALYFDKPVVVLGDAVYKPRGIFPLLDDILDRKFDHQAYLKAIALLRRFMLGGYLHPSAVLRDVSSFCHRVSLIHQTWQSRQGAPIDFAQDYWTACSLAHQGLARSSMLWGISKPGVSEFTAPAISPTQTCQDLAATQGQEKKVGLLFMSIAKRIAAFWEVWRAGEWIKVNWTTDAGRADVVNVGQIVDAGYYLRTYTDVMGTGVNPIEHYTLYGLKEGRTPQAHITSGLPDNILNQLLACVDRFGVTANTVTITYGGTTEETAAYDAIFERVREHVATLETSSLRDWLASAWADKTMLAKIIKAGKIIDPIYYVNRYLDIAQARVDPIEHYAYIGVHEGRSPRECIEEMQPQALLDTLLTTLDQAEELLALPEHPLPEGQKSLREKSLADIRAAIAKKHSRVAVVAHLYYSDLVPEILERLRAIKEEFDFYVTLPNWGTRRTEELVVAAYPDAVFYPASVRGRDIGPFMDLLPLLVAKNYDAVLKVHTKRGYFRAGKMVREFGEIWRRETFDALIGSSERVDAILEAFRTNTELNAVGPEPFLLSLEAYPYHDDGDLAVSILGAKRGDASVFFAGTMFWVRPSSLRDMTLINLTHFAEEDGANDGALAHLVERMFGEAFTREGGVVAAAPINPNEPLDFEPVAQKMKLDAYFVEREKALQVKSMEKSKKALIWQQ